MTSENYWRSFLKFLDDNPKYESVFEIFFSIVASFLPFVLGAVFVQSKEQEFSFQKYFDTLFSYFYSGELSILILAVCGSIIWITLIKRTDSHIVGRFVLAIFIFLVAILFVGNVIGSNPGFNRELPSWLLYCILFIYVMSLVFWFRSTLSVKKEAGDGQESKSESNVDKILDNA